MSSIVVATSRDTLRAETTVPLLREGFAVRAVADWPGLVRALAFDETRLALVDPELPHLSPQLLASLANTLPNRPTVRSLGDDAPPLERLPATPRASVRLARQVCGRLGLDPAERKLLGWMGLGAEPIELLARLAASPLPILLQGERGTGKERIARVIHRLASRPGTFLTLAAEETFAPGAEPGTVFFESAHRRPELRAHVRQAQDLGWRVVCGSRLPEPIPGIAWARLVLTPLRERPTDLRQLAQHYLDQHARRMGLPRRSLDRGMWALLHAHRWPGNARELEMFVVQVLGSVDAAVVRGAELRDDLRALLLPRAEGPGVESFEEMARARLLPVVTAYSPGGTDTLHEIVVASAERALIQLVLARTQGNRKAAAALLGIARNTLQARIEALGLGSSA
ncbi:MAG: helix-turn-helix domain-containing protein [Myxococcota bacterium]